MRITVINLRKIRPILSGVKIVSILLLIFLAGIVINNFYINSKSYVSALAGANESNIIIIDAGHGGEDPGAIGVNGKYEKDLNLDIAFIIGEILTERGFSVVYTRSDDRLLYTEEENIKGIRKISDLKNRCKIAAEYPNAMFVSIHMNSYGKAQYSGLQVYFSENNEYSKILASSIQSSVKNELQPQNKRVIKPGKDIYLLENISNVCALIECGFLTNPLECQKISEKEYQKQLSLSIVCGIINYIDKTSIK